MMSDVLDDLLAERHRVHRGVLDSGGGVGPAPGQVDPSLAFLVELGNDEQCATIADAYGRLAADLTASLDEHLRSTRRAPRPGITTDDLGLIWLALVQGARRLRCAAPLTNVSFGAAAETIVRELTVDD